MKLFAFVCVDTDAHTRTHAHRRSHVRTHHTQVHKATLRHAFVADICDFFCYRYLQLKHPKIKRGRLGFESKGDARNTVLYMLPADFD
jgi:hypothetical protein